VADLFHVAFVRAATATQYVQLRQFVLEIDIAIRQVFRIALVEFLGFIQLSVGFRRRVGAQTADSIGPRFITGQDLLEVRRVGAINHVVGRSTIGCGVDLFDRITEQLAAG